MLFSFSSKHYAFNFDSPEDIMPLLRSEAPASIPDEETLEYLLGERASSATTHHRRKTKAYNELDDEAKARTGLVTLGQRQEIIPGDPHGIYPCWAGNVGHQRDSRMFAIIEPLVAQLNSLTIHESDAIKRIREFLAEVPLTDPETLARKYGNDSKYDVLQDTEYEMAVTFHILTKSVRVVNKIDVDMEDPETYEDNKQAKESEGIIDDIFDEVEMHVLVQQHLVSAILAEDPNATNQTPTSAHGIELWLTDLRNRARHRYWFGMTKSERSVVREEALSEVYYKDVHEDHVQTVRKHWPDFWDNSKEDPDPFQQYLKDQLAVEKGIWTLVEEDILIVTDVNNRVLFANVEGLAQLLFDSGPRADRNTGTDTKEASNPDAGTDTNIIDLMFRLIDMWSFFTPLPAPEANCHPVDSYIREIHPELDMSKANVAQLQNAKMCMAHYGFWSTPHDIAARQLFRSPDALFTRSLDQDYCRDLFPGFFQAAMGKATSLIRFLVEPLDPVHYAECKDVFAAIPDNRKLTTGSSSSDKPEDFLSLFGLGINGFTQRHHDPRDVVNGLAGLCTFGQCTGGDLCLPQLGIRVPYRPGACAILRGSELEHLVSDYDGTRFFIVGTNHESARYYGLCELARMHIAGKRQQPAPCRG